MTMTTRFILSFVLWQTMFISLLLVNNLTDFLINFELAFFVAALIIYSSYQGYSKMIKTAVHNDMHMDVKNPLDAIEDPYELYDEENMEEEQHAIDKKNKKDGLKKMMKTRAGHGSWKRILSYLLLVLIFMTLKNNGILNIAGFLTGLTLGMIFAGLLGKRLLSN